ncbi:MAG: hypothetical protein K8U03_16170 [Planctomycetia bacterium]|nr:hypothetical protein [Planctomycetia bacterium]
MSTVGRTYERPLHLRCRRDLIIVEQTIGTELYWIIKDPLTLRFARLREFEYLILTALDGRTGIAELVDLFEARFAPQRIRPDEVSRFVSSLHQLDFLISDSSGQGDVLVERRSKRRFRSFWSRWMNPLSLRFSVVDPTGPFDLLLPFARWIFSPLAAAAAALLFVAAAVALALQWTKFTSQLPHAQELFTPSNVLFVGAVLAGVKVLHEFGHGLACRRFGGECRDLGVMLLIFTPCLYCDVTDAWRFQSRWKRIAVAAAGMYFEFILAAIAALIWSTAEPGLLSRVCLTVIVVASVGTLFFNGNPLMRYDGYYILSDLVEVPNLSQRSASAFRQLLLRALFGKDAPLDPLAPLGRQRWYLLYAVASTLYRWGLTIAIVLMLVAAARPYRLENLSRAVGIVMIGSIATATILYLRQMLPAATKRDRMKPARITLIAAASFLLLALIFFVPVRHSVLGPMELQLKNAEQLYVEIPGRIAALPASYGSRLAAGAPIVRLENHELELDIERLSAKCERLRIDLATLKREAFDNAGASGSIPQSEKLLASIEQQLRDKRQDRDRLVPVAHRAGTLYPPPAQPSSHSPDELAAWTGRPLDPTNLGGTLEVGTPLGSVGDPHRWQAAIVLDQEDVDFVRPNDRVEILLDALPEETLHGTVAEIALGELRESPRRLSNKSGGELATKAESGTTEAPASTSYLVRVDLDDPEGRFRQGWRGTARVRVAPKPLGSRWLRSLSRTFHFDW